MLDPEITQRLEVREVVYNADGSRRADKLLFELEEEAASRYVQAHARHPGIFPEYETATPKRYELRLRGTLIDTADSSEDAIARIDMHHASWRGAAQQALSDWTVVDRQGAPEQNAQGLRDGIAWPPDNAELEAYFAQRLAAAAPMVEEPAPVVETVPDAPTEAVEEVPETDPVPPVEQSLSLEELP